MKKKIVVAVLLLALALLALVGCSQTAEEFYRDLDKSIVETAVKFDEAYGVLSGLTTYRYTTEVYLERMSNYDAVNKKFPDEKEWYKPSFGYEFVRDGDAEYVKMTYESTVYEFWYDGGVLSQTKVDGVVVSEISADKREGYDLFREYFFADDSEYNLAFDIVNRYDDIESDARADSVAAARAETILGKEVVNYLTYDITLNGGVAEGWRTLSTDENVTAVTGYDEDLKISWSEVETLAIGNMCINLQKGSITMIEMYNEIIGAYHKSEEQAWDNLVADKWYGDRIEADKLILSFEYPSKKVTVTVPAK